MSESQAGALGRYGTAAGIPVVLRELTVAGRQKRTYVVRTLLALIVGGSILSAILISRLGTPSPFLGLTVFSVYSWIAVTFVMLLGPVTAATSIADERREDTLGLLFLTDLRSGGIVLGKFTSASTFMLQLILVGTPFLFSGVVLGGVALSQTLHVLAIITATGLAATAIGLFVGTITENPVPAILGSLFLSGFLLGLPLIVGAFLDLAGGPFATVAEVLFTANAFSALSRELTVEGSGDGWLWASLAASGAALLALLAAAVRVWRLRISGDVRPSTRDGFMTRPLSRFGAARPDYIDVKNPVYELEVRQSGGALERVLRLFIYLGGPLMCITSPIFVHFVPWVAGIFFAIYLLAGLFVGLAMAVVAATVLGQEREDGTLELLLTTNMTPTQIVNGKLMALMRRFGLPFLVLQILVFIAFAVNIGIAWMPSGSSDGEFTLALMAFGAAIFSTLVSATAQVIHAVALVFMAMTLGVRVNVRSALAAVIAIFIGGMCLSTCGCPFSYGMCVAILAVIEIVVAAVCYHDLTVNLRRYAIRN